MKWCITFCWGTRSVSRTQCTVICSAAESQGARSLRSGSTKQFLTNFWHWKLGLESLLICRVYILALKQKTSALYGKVPMVSKSHKSRKINKTQSWGYIKSFYLHSLLTTCMLVFWIHTCGTVTVPNKLRFLWFWLSNFNQNMWLRAKSWYFLKWL